MTPEERRAAIIQLKDMAHNNDRAYRFDRARFLRDVAQELQRLDDIVETPKALHVE